ncbi:hypothetical protein Tco_0339932 [Tanacetum coccineum]
MFSSMNGMCGLSEGSGTTPKVPDEPKDNSAVVAEKQAGYVQTNLTLSFAELEIQSMVDVPIHQEDLADQRTPLIDPTFQKEFRSAGWCKENSDGQKTVVEDKHPSDTKVLTMKDGNPSRANIKQALGRTLGGGGRHSGRGRGCVSGWESERGDAGVGMESVNVGREASARAGTLMSTQEWSGISGSGHCQVAAFSSTTLQL